MDTVFTAGEREYVLTAHEDAIHITYAAMMLVT